MAGEWARQHVRAGSVEEAEEAAMEIGQAVGQAVGEALMGETAEGSYEGCSRACGCGRRAKFVGYRAKYLVTLVGVVRVSRPYYHCRHCGRGQLPWDVAQGLGERCYTPRVKAVVAEVAARLTYGETVELLGRLTPLRLEESAAEWLVAEVGGRVRQREAEQMSAYVNGRVPLPEGPAAERLYVTMDGSYAHVDGDWSEVRTGAVYEGAPGKEGVDTSGPKRYVSAREKPESFGERLYVVAAQAGVHRAREKVVIGDGAPWIWKLADHHYPGATEIVDYWHACQHIHEFAQRRYGEASEAGKRWARDHCQRLREKGPLRLIRALKRMPPRSAEEAELLRTELGFFRRNVQRMQYPRFRQRGLMIGSGPAEAACKLVVAQRLKRPGMRWKHDGADHILALRCLVLNQQYDNIRICAKAA